MKNLISKTLLTIATGLVVVSMATPANAEPSIMRVSVPFAFVAGDHTYSAGDYWFRLDSAFRVVDVRAASQVASTRVALTGGRMSGKGMPADEGALIFNRYDDTYLLVGVWARGAAEGLLVAPSKLQAELARTHRGGAAADTIVQTVR